MVENGGSNLEDPLALNNNSSSNSSGSGAISVSGIERGNGEAVASSKAGAAGGSSGGGEREKHFYMSRLVVNSTIFRFHHRAHYGRQHPVHTCTLLCAITVRNPVFGYTDSAQYSGPHSYQRCCLCE